MNHLLRQLAPISDAAWEMIEQEAKPRLTTYLSARQLVDFAGPAGWRHSATDLGRVTPVEAPCAGVATVQRRVLPLVELRAEFHVSRAELDDVERGADDIDFADLDRAAKSIALAENMAIFGGFRSSGIRGITEASSRRSVALGDDYSTYPASVASAVNTLLGSGISGPFGLAISPEGYTGIIETTEAGDLLLDHLGKILAGPVVWTPGVDGAVVVSLRGGDFALDVGEDLSIGYLDHTADSVRLYFEESFSFRVVEPDAAVVLSPAGGARAGRGRGTGGRR
jgi:uncharacterized linocin/CFP29 family protein